MRGSLKSLVSKSLSFAGKWQQQQLRRLNIHEYQKLGRDGSSDEAKFINRQPQFFQESRSNKSILHEFTFKNHGEIPMYKTILGEGGGSLPVYVSRVTVNDKTFTGAGARSKKEAEQFAARTARCHHDPRAKTLGRCLTVGDHPIN